MRYWVISHIEDFKLGDQVATYKNTQKIKIRFSPKVVLYNDLISLYKFIWRVNVNSPLYKTDEFEFRPFALYTMSLDLRHTDMEGWGGGVPDKVDGPDIHTVPQSVVLHGPVRSGHREPGPIMMHVFLEFWQIQKMSFETHLYSFMNILSLIFHSLQIFIIESWKFILYIYWFTTLKVELILDPNTILIKLKRRYHVVKKGQSN